MKNDLVAHVTRMKNDLVAEVTGMKNDLVAEVTSLSPARWRAGLGRHIGRTLTQTLPAGRCRS